MPRRKLDPELEAIVREAQGPEARARDKARLRAVFEEGGNITVGAAPLEPPSTT